MSAAPSCGRSIRRGPTACRYANEPPASREACGLLSFGIATPSGGLHAMKAAYIQKFGGPEVLTYGDLPDPTAGPGQVVVDTHAASINAADWKVAAGEYNSPKFPVVLGRDFSGVVSAVGS